MKESLSVIKEIIAYVCPVLIVSWLVYSLVKAFGVLKRSGGAGIFVTVFAAGAASLFPLRGLSISDWILSLNPNFSVGTMVLMTLLVLKGCFKKELLPARDYTLFLLWNVLLSLFLFVPSLGYTSYDLYAGGYAFSSLFILLFVITVLLLLLRRPLAYVFLLYIFFYDLDLLPSQNLFDYITDGMLFFASIGVVISQGLKTRIVKEKISRS